MAVSIPGWIFYGSLQTQQISVSFVSVKNGECPAVWRNLFQSRRSLRYEIFVVEKIPTEDSQRCFMYEVNFIGRSSHLEREDLTGWTKLLTRGWQKRSEELYLPGLRENMYYI